MVSRAFLPSYWLLARTPHAKPHMHLPTLLRGKSHLKSHISLMMPLLILDQFLPLSLHAHRDAQGAAMDMSNR